MKSDLSRWYDEALQQVARVGKDMFGVDKTEDLVLSQIARGLLGRPDCLPPDGKTELRVCAAPTPTAPAPGTRATCATFPFQ